MLVNLDSDGSTDLYVKKGTLVLVVMHAEGAEGHRQRQSDREEGPDASASHTR